MSEMKVTQQTTLQQLQDFAKTVKDGHQLRAKTDEHGVTTLYSKSPGKLTFNTKEKERPEKFDNARQVIRQVLERNTGGKNVDRILNGIMPKMGGHRGLVPQPLTGAKLHESLKGLKNLESKEREKQDESLRKVDMGSLLQRQFTVSGSGTTGVIFAKDPNEGGNNDVVLKFEPKENLQRVQLMFEVLDKVSGMPGELPFTYGRHEIVEPGEHGPQLEEKLGESLGGMRDQIRELCQKYDVTPGKGQPLFDNNGNLDNFAFDRLRQRASPEDKETFVKLDSQMARLGNMQRVAREDGQFSKYTRLEARPLDKLSSVEKHNLLVGGQFSQDMGKGGMIVSLLGLNDHGGVGISNVGNFLISETGKLSIVDIITPEGQSTEGGMVRGTKQDAMINECKVMAKLIGGNIEKSLQQVLENVMNGEEESKKGGLGRFAMSTLGAPTGDRLFSEGQDQDHQDVVGRMGNDDKVRVLANYLLGAYEGMKFIVDNKEELKGLLQERELGIGTDNKRPDPDKLLREIEKAYNSISNNNLEELTRLAR